MSSLAVLKLTIPLPGISKLPSGGPKWSSYIFTPSTTVLNNNEKAKIKLWRQIRKFILFSNELEAESKSFSNLDSNLQSAILSADTTSRPLRCCGWMEKILFGNQERLHLSQGTLSHSGNCGRIKLRPYLLHIGHNGSGGNNELCMTPINYKKVSEHRYTSLFSLKRVSSAFFFILNTQVVTSKNA